ncbi:MAG: hypothetical protein J6B04_06285 [Clostridia bacterium]|nr:hypothetical protein [Clostridia bacterium]
MSQYEIYVLILCLIVFTVLTVLLGIMLGVIVKQTIRAINAGLEDDKIKKEYLGSGVGTKFSGVLNFIISVIFCAVVLAFFVFSMYTNYTEDKLTDNMPTLRVVNSGSMAEKHERNTYLTQNNLNDQFQTFDLILTYKLPDEFDLQLYDIVVYEVDDVLIVHRIVRIEEPNAEHPDCRHFVLQGDAVPTHDRVPVLYKQMKAIYRGERIPYVGSFVAFLQSPAGWLCILLIVVYTIATPIIESKVKKAKRQRFYAALTTDADVDQQQLSGSELKILANDVNDKRKQIALAREEMLKKYEEIRSLEKQLNESDPEGFYEDFKRK